MVPNNLHRTTARQDLRSQSYSVERQHQMCLMRAICQKRNQEVEVTIRTILALVGDDYEICEEIAASLLVKWGRELAGYRHQRIFTTFKRVAFIRPAHERFDRNSRITS